MLRLSHRNLWQQAQHVTGLHLILPVAVVSVAGFHIFIANGHEVLVVSHTI